MYTGFVLTSFGATTVGVGAFTMVALGDQSGELSGLGAALIGGPIVLSGMGLLGAGIPLWITGARSGEQDPTLEFSLRGDRIGLEGTF